MTPVKVKKEKKKSTTTACRYKISNDSIIFRDSTDTVDKT